MYSVKISKKVKLLSFSSVIVALGVVSIVFGTLISYANSSNDLPEQEKISLLSESQNTQLISTLTNTVANLRASVYNAFGQTNSTSSGGEAPNSATANIVPYPSEVAADAPIAFYRFSEASGATVADSSGNNRTMTLSGNYTRNAAELLLNQTATNKGLAIQGATATAGGLTATNAISVSMMVKFSSIGGNNVFLESGTFSSSTVGYHQFGYYAASQQLRWYYNKSDGSGFNSVGFNFVPVLGRNYHLTVTHNYTTKTISIYVDGLAGASFDMPTGALPITNQSVSFFNGLQATVDELALFNTALSQNRVEAQFAASRGADATSTIYYSSPQASIYGRGTPTDPIDLQTAFNTAFVKGGKSLELLEGNYVGILDIKRSGSNGNRIKIQGQLGKRVTIDGAGLEGHVLQLSGNYIDVTRLELKKTWNVRTSNISNTQGAPITGTNGTLAGEGLYDGGDNNRAYYNIIHDCLGDGIASFSSATNSEYYGNLVYNNGWFAPRIVGGIPEANGHGFYTQNTAPSIKKIKKNIVFNPYSSTMKLAGSGVGQVENYELEKNLSVGGSFIYDIGGGDNGANNINLVGERTFQNEVKLGYNTNAGRTISIVDSYIHGYSTPLNIDNFNSIVMTGNTVVGSGGAAGGSIQIRVKTAFSNSTVNYNTYYHNRPDTPYVFIPALGANATYSNETFATWKARTGWDLNSTYIANGTALTQPTVNRVFIEPMNEYEANRGYIAVYNWANTSTQSVNLSSFLATGTQYEIRSASNYYAGAILSGTYNGGSVTLPLTLAAGLPAQAAPYGDIQRNPETAPKFAAFLITPLSQTAPTPTPTPTPTATPTPTPTPTPTATPTPTPTPTAARSTLFDFEGDGKSDVSLFRPADTTWYMLLSQSGYTSFSFGNSSDKLAAADYDGDGKTDIAVWREADLANFHILQSSTNTVRTEQFGQTGDTPIVVGDWDGDGKADPAVYRNGTLATGQSFFFYRPSSQPGVNFVPLYWGSRGDIPQCGDFDGDGRMDAAVFRPSNNIWYIRQSSNGQLRAEQWGISTDRFVSGDYDGDGKTDLAVFRNGVWYLNQSTDGFKAIQFGISTDKPIAADYDGDGKTDVAVFRDGIWYLQKSRDGFVSVVFGSPNDKAVANAFVP